MLMEPTLEKMNAMKLTGMVAALEQQRGSTTHAKLSFDERLGLLVDAEWAAREQRKLKTRLRAADTDVAIWWLEGWFGGKPVLRTPWQSVNLVIP